MQRNKAVFICEYKSRDTCHNHCCNVHCRKKTVRFMRQLYLTDNPSPVVEQIAVRSAEEQGDALLSNKHVLARDAHFAIENGKHSGPSTHAHALHPLETSCCSDSSQLLSWYATFMLLLAYALGIHDALFGCSSADEALWLLQDSCTCSLKTSLARPALCHGMAR